jgi:hypothetical protein
MRIHAARQARGYKVLDSGVKCGSCNRALDDYDVSSCREASCPSREEL